MFLRYLIRTDVSEKILHKSGLFIKKTFLKLYLMKTVSREIRLTSLGVTKIEDKVTTPKTIVKYFRRARSERAVSV